MSEPKAKSDAKTEGTDKTTSSSTEETVEEGAGVIDESTKATVQKIPLLSVRAGPRDGDDWIKRYKQELNALIKVRNTSLWSSLFRFVLIWVVCANEQAVR